MSAGFTSFVPFLRYKFSIYNSYITYGEYTQPQPPLLLPLLFLIKLKNENEKQNQKAKTSPTYPPSLTHSQPPPPLIILPPKLPFLRLHIPIPPHTPLPLKPRLFFIRPSIRIPPLLPTRALTAVRHVAALLCFPVVAEAGPGAGLGGTHCWGRYFAGG